MTATHAPRLPYDDPDQGSAMVADARVAAAALRRPAPSLRYDDFPRDLGKHRVTVSDAAARLADALHLHLD